MYRVQTECGRQVVVTGDHNFLCLRRGSIELTATEVKEKVREALKDQRFNRQPKIYSNCVRMFYADEDEEKHHVDFPIYRRYYDAN